MGGGSWTKETFCSYSTSVGRSVTSDGCISGSYSANQLFQNRKISSVLSPRNVMRECCDSDEHPNTVPVILALDVTGSMGSSAVEVAKKLNILMNRLYNSVKDVEFMIMGIGDVECDSSPIQASQFESDIRIAQQLDELYFEGGGGVNSYESYTAAWYFGLNNTKLDCWKRGKKGLIITLGDEPLNPELAINKRFHYANGYGDGLNEVLGCSEQKDVATDELYKAASEKFNIFHIYVKHKFRGTDYDNKVKNSFTSVIGQNYMESDIDSLIDKISEIVEHHATDVQSTMSGTLNENGMLSW